MRLQSILLSGTRQEENPSIKHLVQFIEMKGQWADITRPQGEWVDVTRPQGEWADVTTE